MKKMSNRGTALVEYGILLAFIAVVRAYFVGDSGTALSAAIKTNINAVISLLGGTEIA